MKFMNKKSTRLAGHVIPVEYDIRLRPDFKNFTFEGVETITLKIFKKTKTITLHSKELEIETASLTKSDNKIFAQKISYNQKEEMVTFLFPKYIRPTEPVKVEPLQFSCKGSTFTKKTKLTIVFKGILNDKMRGFYRSKYFLDGKEHYIATTQFESTDARRAFPCFDEPARKAVFHVSLVTPKGKMAISNTLPISVAEHEAGFEIVKFSPTPRMSTYLLAFIIGDFEFLETKSKMGIKVRVFTTPGKKHQAKFALKCAAKTLDFYEKYFDIKYPLPALDLIAIPDFTAGAMENWGAVTYRESALLVDENHSSVSNKQWVALVIAHELAHQWFGNLVTMQWWTHLWLNEGFASYMEYLAVGKLFPGWDIWTQFLNHDSGVALRLDALQNTHPVEIKVHHPDEIGEIFDEVSYSKGASIIRMLAEHLGEKKFRDGLRYYLKKHSYQNTETIHLWQAFEKISGQPVKKIMHNWTAKPGYPLIKAEMKKNDLVLSQGRFFASPVSKTKNRDKTIWQVPISIQSPNSSHKLLLSSRSAKLIGAPTAKFQKVNSGESGFFRVAYSKELLEKLIEPVFKKTLSPRDRLGIIRDLFALSESGDIKTTDALKFLKAYEREDNYTVWLEIASGLEKLEQLLYKTENEPKLNRLIIKLFRPVFKRLGWKKRTGEPHADTLLRPLCIAKLGMAGDLGVIAKAKKKFQKIIKGVRVNPDLRRAIYGIAARNGGMKEYNILVKKYKKETLSEEKDRIGSALGDFTSNKILRLASHFALSKNVRSQDTLGILSSLGGNPAGRDVWFECIKHNWLTLVSRYGEGGHTLARFVKAISGSAEPKHLRAFEKFFKTHNAPGAERAVAQVIEKLESNILWLKRDRKNIESFLSNFK